MPERIGMRERQHASRLRWRVIDKVANRLGASRRLADISDDDIGAVLEGEWGMAQESTWNRNRAAVNAWLTWPAASPCPLGAPVHATSARTPATPDSVTTAPKSSSKASPDGNSTSYATPQRRTSATRKSPPADHGQDPPQVAALGDALHQPRPRSRRGGHRAPRSTPTKALMRQGTDPRDPSL